MSSDYEQRFHDLISQALEHPPTERRTFLVSACAEDDELLDDVWRAVAADGVGDDGFLETPPFFVVGKTGRQNGATTRVDRELGRREVDVRDPSSRTHGSTSLMGRMREAPGFSIFVVFTLIWPFLLAASVLGGLEFLASPDTGLGFGFFSGRVSFQTELWPAAGVGDELVSIGGRDAGPDPVRVRAAFLNLPAGEVLIQFRRGLVEWSARGQARARNWRQHGAVWTRMITGGLLFLIATAAFVLRPGAGVTWLFLVFCGSLGCHLLADTALLRRPPEALILESFGLCLAAASGLHLFTVFPGRFFRQRRWINAVYTVSILALCLLVVGYRWPRAQFIIGPVFTFIRTFPLLTALASVLLVVAQYKRAMGGGDAIAGARCRALLVAVMIGLMLPASLGVLILFKINFSGAHASFLVIVFVLVTGYSIVRHNALEVDRFTSAVLGYTLTTLVLGLAFGALVVAVPTWIGRARLFESPVAIAGTTAAFVMLVQPLYRRLGHRLDRWFEREPVADDTVLNLLRKLSDSVRTDTLAGTRRVGVETALALHGERAEIWSREDETGAMSRTFWEGEEGLSSYPSVALSGPLAEALAGGSGGVEGLVDTAYGGEAQAELWRRDLALVAPFYVGDQLQGFVGLARKRSGSGYSRRERTFLEAVASQIGLATERELEQSERVGPYRLLERLGTGGMAEVFRARKHGPGGFERQAAVKRMMPHLAEDADCVAMFLDEARIAARFRHPNIVQIYDIEKHGDNYYLAMELLDGPSLSLLLRQAADAGVRLPLKVVATISVAVLRALAYSHDLKSERGEDFGVVHRDVKPGNILLSQQGEIKLSDFGIARAEFRLYQTRTGLVRGTPGYMAPEQQDGGRIDRRTDLFAAGAVIYEMLTVKRASKKRTLGGTLTPPSTLDAKLPKALDGFTAQAMAGWPEDRFSSATEMAEAFLAAIFPWKPASAEEVAACIWRLK